MAGTIYAAFLVIQWVTSGYESLPRLTNDNVAFTAIVFGVQTVFGSFFMSAIGDRVSVGRGFFSRSVEPRGVSEGPPGDGADGFVFAERSAEPVARCREVTREYRRSAGRAGGRVRGSGGAPGVTALDGVSIEVHPGETLGLRGPSGSGKSTLVHLLAGLDTPTSGTVEVVGTDLGAASERARTRLRLDHVGIVFQSFYLLPSLTAQSNVALPLIEAGIGKAERRARATELLERVGLADRTEHRPGELSGGEQQRVAIARALVNDPELLLADEPTGELDSRTGERVLELLTEVADDRAVVIASHDEQALSAADRVVRLRDGRVTDDGR